MENTLLKGLYNDTLTKVAAYQNGYNDREPKKALKALKSAMSESVKKYNLELSKAQYKEWATTGEPVKEAIRSNIIPGAIKVQNKTDDNDHLTCIIVADTSYQVSLPMMQYVLGKDIFADPNWFKMAEKTCLLVANAINTDLGGNALFTYDCEKASRDFDMPAGCDPLSERGALIALQTLMDKILFIEKVTGNGKSKKVVNAIQIQDKREWRTIRESMTRSGGVNVVEICNTSNFITLVMNAMYGIMTNGNFALNAVSSDLHDLFKEEEDAE